jgi:hypothetical protein
MFSKIATVSFALLASSSLVAGHAAIIGATGDAGGAGSAIGGTSLPKSVTPTTGHVIDNQQLTPTLHVTVQVASLFSKILHASRVMPQLLVERLLVEEPTMSKLVLQWLWCVSFHGLTSINIPDNQQQLNGATLPQITPGGTVSMTLHQVNGDGAGPYTCMMDATGTGEWF